MYNMMVARSQVLHFDGSSPHPLAGATPRGIPQTVSLPILASATKEAKTGELEERGGGSGDVVWENEKTIQHSRINEFIVWFV